MSYRTDWVLLLCVVLIPILIVAIWVVAYFDSPVRS